MTSKTKHGLKVAGIVGGSAAAVGLTAFVLTRKSNTSATTTNTSGGTSLGLSGTSSTSGTPSGQSPYGTNPSAPSKSCPSGYSPKYVKGYGWSCVETVAQEQTNYQKMLSQLPSQGVDFSTTGTTPVNGLTPAQEAAQTQSYLEKKYGGTYVVLQQNGRYLVTPASRAASLDQLPNPTISSSPSLSSANASALNQAIADAQKYNSQYSTHYTVYRSPSGSSGYQYDVLPVGQSIPSGSTLLYSTSSGSTSAAQQILSGTTNNTKTYTSNTGAVSSTSATNTSASSGSSTATTTQTSSTTSAAPGPSGTPAAPTLTYTSLQYRFNTNNGCDFYYYKIAHYSDGTTKNLGTVVQTKCTPASSTTITIPQGATLSQIAAEHGTTVAALQAANGISNPNLIYAGQTLKIPS